MESLQGKLLVAPPDELDPDFVKTVILLIQHSREQAVGVVLNRRTATPVKELWRSVIKKRCDLDQYVNSGGPVPGPPMAIHTNEALSEIEILPGVHYCVKKKHLEQLGRQPHPRVKVFDSHAGWGPGQLEGQIQRRSWRIAPGTVEHVFHREEDLSEEVAKQVGH